MTKVATKGFLKALVSEDVPSLVSRPVSSVDAWVLRMPLGWKRSTSLPNRPSQWASLSSGLPRSPPQKKKALPGSLSPFHFPPPCFHAAWPMVYCSEYCELASCCLLKNDLAFVACVLLILHLALSRTRDARE